jgi:hypothetical protein
LTSNHLISTAHNSEREEEKDEDVKQQVRDRGISRICTFIISDDLINGKILVTQRNGKTPTSLTLGTVSVASGLILLAKLHAMRQVVSETCA